MRKGKGIQNTLIIVLALVIITMSVGYALSDIELSIDNNSYFREIKWSIIWDEETYVETTGTNAVTSSMTDEGGARVATEFNTESTAFTSTVRLNKPGEFYEFTINAKNDGDIDAKCSSIDIIGSEEKFVKYTVTYGDEEPFTTTGTTDVSIPLDAGDSETVKVRIEYVLPDSEDDLPIGNNEDLEGIDDNTYQLVELSAYFNYVQNTETTSVE